MWTDRKAGQAETEGTVRGPQGSKKVENPAMLGSLQSTNQTFLKVWFGEPSMGRGRALYYSCSVRK